MNATIRSVACSWAVLLGSAALLWAQQAQPTAQPQLDQSRAIQPGQPAQPRPGIPGQPGQPGQFGRQGGLHAQQLEPSIVTLLIIDNNKEIALGQLGHQTSQNEDVKHFCEMLIKDHSNFVEKLQERTAAGAGRQPGFGAAPAGQGLPAGAQTITQPAPPRTAGQPGAAASAQRDASGQPRSDATAAQERRERDAAQETRTATQERGQLGQRLTVARPMIPNQPGSELLQLHHELAEKCLETARKEAEKHAAEFDQHFLGAQIVAHKEMLDKLQVFENHVSPQTRQLLSDAQETTRKHLQEAMSLHEKVSKESREGGAASRRTESRQDRQ
jgi:predicted outer membrane protein